jgi:serine phosphatase RsbU (regulator of sigma subunit)
MSLRTQLALTFLALTIVPLGGLVAYSYHSSSRAVREALEEDAAVLAAEMDRKLETARGWVRERFEGIAPIRYESLVESAASIQTSAMERRVVAEMGGAAPLVEALEFIPDPTAATRRPPPAPSPESPVPLPPAPRERGSGQPAAPPVPPAPPRIVIDVDKVLRDLESLESLEALEALEALGSSSEPKPGETGQRVDQSLSLAMRSLTLIPSSDEIRKAVSEALEENREEIRKAQEEQARQIARRLTDEAGSASRQETIAGPGSQGETEKPAATAPPERSHRIIRVTPGHAPAIPVIEEDGRVVGSVRARFREDEMLREIMLSTASADEIPFAIETDGTLHSRDDESERLIRELGIPEKLSERPGQTRFVEDQWVVATTTDPATGLLMGVVRPAAEALAEVRRATVRSLALGLALLGIALVGIFPLSAHMTRDIAAVTRGAEKISSGDLQTTVPVRSKNEVGRLATAFNRMARDLEVHQQRLVEEESARREEAVRGQLLKAQYDRTLSELDDAREFQLSMLPSHLPERDDLDFAVEMITAAEVGGDYYDFREDQGALTIAIGDGTGHGAKAGTMVAVMKSLFTALQSHDLASFLSEASATIRSMHLGRMSMALTLARLEGRSLRFAAAGMPPLLHYRSSTGAVVEYVSPGAPLGTIPFPYRDVEVGLEPGDLVVLMTDGLPELPNSEGDPFGYERLSGILAANAARPPRQIIEAFLEQATLWRGEFPQNDDLTIIVFAYRGQGDGGAVGQ